VAAQHGVASRGQLLAAGLTRRQIERRVASGEYRQIHRGVYLAAPFQPPHAHEMAAVLAW
jgi:putative AbiEi antitoxin of type IV toxin-antitoxin system